MVFSLPFVAIFPFTRLLIYEGYKNMKSKGKTFKKEEIDKIMKDVDRKLEEFIKGGNYKDVLLMMGNLGKYSIINQIYILLQKPDATTVKGMHAWNSLGRSVKKGEKGIKIIAPIVGTIDENGKEQNEEKEVKKAKVIKAYKPSYVFDISQTEGKEIKTFQMDEDPSVENKELIIHGLNNVIEAEGYSFRYATKEELGEGCYGLCNHKEKEILLLEGMSDLLEISTFVHECGHALAHNPYKKNFEGLTSLPSRDIKEVEAESISCIICSYLGLNTSNFNFAYISGWAEGDISKFRKNIDVISHCAMKLVIGIDDVFFKDKNNPRINLVAVPKTNNVSSIAA